MNLFVINRYESEKEQTGNEKKHLSELLKRIEERKRQRVAKNDEEIHKSNIENSQESECSKKKRKKEKTECLTQSGSISENVTQNNNEPKKEMEIGDQQQSHRKRKRKKKGNISNEKNNINNESTKTEDVRLHSESIDDQGNEVSNDNLISSDKVQEKVVEQQTDFMILGNKSKKEKHEVKRVLPEWLAKPEVISIDLNSGPSLEELNSILDSKLIQVLRVNGIDKLFPVQASMVSWLLKCDKDRQQGWWLRDTCVSAPTGSGKTLAYVLPIVQILYSRLVPKIRCLIVVPVQELASQVYKVMITYTSHTNLRVGLLSGASSFDQEQSNILKKNVRGDYVSLVDIVVATPGRLIDHILKTPGFSLDDLRFLVIDEADRAADWLEYLPEPHYRAPQLTLFNLRCSKIPAQKLLFSATLSQDPEKLNYLGLFQPILFTSVLASGKDDDINLDEGVGDFVGRFTSPEELTEQAVECAAEYKPVALYHLLIRNTKIFKTLVFTNSGKSAHRLAILLQSLLSGKNVMVGELSAQLTSKEREDVLRKFIVGETQILISSDALARGVDIPDVQLVVSYDLPKYIKGYIHRAGRTGRAGKLGTAVSILTYKQVGIFKDMLNNAHKAIPDIEKLKLVGIADEINYSRHVEKLKHVLEEEKQNNLLHAKAIKRI
ncbi:ATP-dependent RNA helicase DDX51 [Anthophora plagiata]